MTLSRLTKRVVLTAASLTLGVLPLAAPSPAVADTHTASLTVGAVPLPQVPVTACLDTTCVSTPVLSSVTLRVSASVTSGSLAAIILMPATCPGGGQGAAIQVTSIQPVTITVSGSVSGTSSSGPVDIPLGPVTQTIVPGTPGLLVSACTTG